MKNIVHRAIANARERGRTESINNAFNKLRTLLPTEPAERKLSKVEILRLATSYIRHLANIQNARLNGLSEKNVCTKSKHDFCTFCVTTTKPNLVPNQEASSTIIFENDDDSSGPIASDNFCDFHDETLTIFVPMLNNNHGYVNNECLQFWTTTQ